MESANGLEGEDLEFSFVTFKMLMGRLGHYILHDKDEQVLHRFIDDPLRTKFSGSCNLCGITLLILINSESSSLSWENFLAYSFGKETYDFKGDVKYMHEEDWFKIKSLNDLTPRLLINKGYSHLLCHRYRNME